MTNLILYSILSAAFFYLGSRARITQVIWQSYPLPLARFFDCAACSGTWYGLILSLTLGRYQGLDVMGFDAQDWMTPIIVALSMLVLTPIVARLMHLGLQDLGTAIDEPLTVEERKNLGVSPSE